MQAADHPPLYIIYLAAFSLFGVRSHHRAPAGLDPARRRLGRWWPAWPGARSSPGRAAVGLVGAVLVAVYPNTWRYDGMLLSESMVILTVLVTVWLAYRYWHRPTRWRMAAVGAVVGLAALSRSRAGAVRAAPGPAARAG